MEGAVTLNDAATRLVNDVASPPMMYTAAGANAICMTDRLPPSSDQSDLLTMSRRPTSSASRLLRWP